MDCQKLKEYIYPFIDGELDTHTSLLVKEHILACPLCGLELEQEKRLDSLIRQNISKDKASFELKERILDSIGGTRTYLRPALAVVSLTFLALIFVLPSLLNKPKSSPIFTDSISSHIRFLQGRLPVEIASDNPGKLSRWFEGKVDFAVNVPDLSRKGATLIGGRLHHLMENKTAYLIYQMDGHTISAFVIDMSARDIRKGKRLTGGKNIFSARGEKGYQSILCIDKGGIGCIFVSELSEEELMRLVS